MAPESDGREPVREVRLEGARLTLALVVVVALLGASFWIGRLYERATAPAAGGARQDPLANVKPGVEDAPDDSTFFDTLSGNGKSAEPDRETRAPATAAPAPPVTAPRGGDGPFVVQVFAGRDRRAAEELVSSLRGKGYPVRIDGEREGRGTLFRVRVGGYATRAEAEAAADRLVKDGQAGAWVTRRD